MTQQAHIMMKYMSPAKQLPLDIGTIHLVGIGGIGMSGIAEILHNLGYHVSGSDMGEGPNVQRLRALGITVHVGHDASNVTDAAVLVKSTAVPMSNPEILAAKEAGIPVVRRSEMLAELTRLKATIAVAGSHGKTTTTSMVAHLLASNDYDPTVINGGIINRYGTNAHLGEGEWLVAEADESDGTFIKLPATVGIITNIDPEHLDYWGDFASLKQAFATFVSQLPFYGFAVLCVDDPEVQVIASDITDRRIVTYSAAGNEADITLQNVKTARNGQHFSVTISARASHSGQEETLQDVFLPMPGLHNASNALAAMAVAYQLGIAAEKIASAMAEFEGVKRRFTYVGERKGAVVIDDYAHHPEEVMATLKAAKESVGNGKVIAVLQPHRYSRVEHLFAEFSASFADADTVVLTDIYAAGEQPIEGVSHDTLADAIRAKGKQVITIEGEADLAPTLDTLATAEDMIICMGAGTISAWAYGLV